MRLYGAACLYAIAVKKKHFILKYKNSDNKYEQLDRIKLQSNIDGRSPIDIVMVSKKKNDEKQIKDKFQEVISYKIFGQNLLYNM